MVQSVRELCSKEWEAQVLKSEKLTVVDFWQEKCPWCLKLNPMLDVVAREYKDRIKFFKMNVMKNEENRKLTIEYGIMSTPTLMFFYKGKPIGQIIGFIPKEKLEKTLDEILERIVNT